MLDEGAGSRSALEIADAIDFLGAELSTTGGVDATYVDLHVPVARLADALPVMADVVARPTFPEAELNRLARGAARQPARDAGRSRTADPGRLPAAGVRRAAPLRHARDRHRGLAEGIDASRISRRSTPPTSGRRMPSWSWPATSPPTRSCRSSNARSAAGRRAAGATPAAAGERRSHRHAGSS